MPTPTSSPSVQPLLNVVYVHPPAYLRSVNSDNTDTINKIVDEIEKVWETRYANGRMKKGP